MSELNNIPSTPRRYSFPIARRVWRIATAARANWLLRHQNRFNFAIHMIGIPLALLVAPALAVWLSWIAALAAFVGGYFLQWIGHQVEGNDVGELIPLKRMLGRPVVAIAPQYASPSPSTLS
jgi:hypothetical protein